MCERHGCSPGGEGVMMDAIGSGGLEVFEGHRGEKLFKKASAVCEAASACRKL